MKHEWFINRNLKVLNYQQDVIDTIQDSLRNNEKTVLAACPSAGKTLITTYIIEKYLKENPTHKVLVLAHGTVVLRTQFYEVFEEYKPEFNFNKVETFSDYDDSCSVNICIPHTLNRKKLSKIDFLIVDEAHQFYFGDKMVRDIIRKIKPKKQLLLTGTPSIFIRKGFPIIPITLNTILDEGMISDLYVEIATSSYSFDPLGDDFNRNNELKQSVYIKKSDTKNTLDDLLPKIVERLKRFKPVRRQNIIPVNWTSVFNQLQKTMWVCKSQYQAKAVKEYFDKAGINTALSISDTDYDSDEIENFKNDPNCRVLIVVGRGILGFNYPELINIVDMTLSHNIDRIFQLLCRVVRKHPDDEKKLFFKISPNTHSDYYKYIMTCVVSMSDENFYRNFNGKNLDGLMIPIKKNNKISGTNNNNGKKNSKQTPFVPMDFGNIPVFELFQDVLHKKDSTLDVYAWTTMKDVRAQFMNQKPPGYWTKEKCIESALKYKNKENWHLNESSAFHSARRNGWYKECTAHMVQLKNPGGYWTKEKCIESASKYKTTTDWRKNEGSAYVVAQKNRWLDECTAHMIKPLKWTKEKCIESASKYKNKMGWIKNESGAASAARVNGWYKECTAHMIPLPPWNKGKKLIEY